MKYLSSQILAFLQQRGVRRNINYLKRFIGMLLLMIIGYSVLFHYIMAYEGRSFSWMTGIYWTLTVMSTLGFGDITFMSDLGRCFSILVLLSGVIFFLVMLPFTFIQYFYAPWLEAQKKEQIPRSVPAGMKGHVILVGMSPITLNLAEDLMHYGTHCVILCHESQSLLDLLDQGYHVVVGDHDNSNAYRKMQAASAAMLVALDTDIRNTSTVFAAREAAPDVPIVARAENEASIDILQLAGSTRVFLFHALLGQALARRVISSPVRSTVLKRFERLVVAEAPVMRTQLVGKSLRECSLRNRTGVNVVGVWERGRFSLPSPDTRFSPFTVLVIAGTRMQIAAFDRLLGSGQTRDPHASTVVLGGGRVGVAVAEQLKERGIPAVVVDREIPAQLHEGGYIRGDAADLEVLERAGIRTASSAVITTHDDDTNIYLTIYCRRLRPDMQIISRASLDRNVGTLHAAGADLVLSLASLMTMSVINLLTPGKLFMINEGLNIFRSAVAPALVGRNLAESGIRVRTNCSVVAVRGPDGVMHVNPEPDFVFSAGDEVYLIGDSTAESAYAGLYGSEPRTGTPEAWKP